MSPSVVGASSELLGCSSALVESAQVQAGVTECFSALIAARVGSCEGIRLLRDAARFCEVATIHRARRHRRRAARVERVSLGHERES